MKNCLACGNSKPDDAPLCPSCRQLDKHAIRNIGTPSRTIFMVALLGLWLYRFWLLGWAALPGNLRVAAFVCVCLGLAGMLFGPMWTFGIRSRKKGFVLFLVGLFVFLVFNSI